MIKIEQINSIKSILSRLNPSDAEEGLKAVLSIERQFLTDRAMINGLRQEMAELVKDNQTLKEMFSKGLTRMPVKDCT